MPEYSVVSKRLPRVDALGKVTGEARYSGDIIFPNMLYGKILRSFYPHALIRRLNTKKAQTLDGVKAIITALDVPGYKTKNTLLFAGNPHMAGDKVVYAEQPIAVVAATSPQIAEEAASLIEVEYDELPPILEAVESMKPDSLLIYPDLYTNVIIRGPGKKDTKPSNIAWHVDYRQGNLETGFKAADLILENTFYTQAVHQGYIEPMAALAKIDSGGKITVWTQSQGIFGARRLIADFVNLPLSRINVLPLEIGGAFGGKTYQLLSPLCALLTLKTGLPVRIEMTREEVLKESRPAPASRINIKMGVTKEGYITATSASIIFDVGAFPERQFCVNAALSGLGPYKIPNMQIEAFDVLTNKVPAGSYRAPAAPQIAFAVESQMDLISRALNIDPLQLRIRNAVEEGDPMPDGATLPHIGFKETLEKIAEHLHHKGDVVGENQGRGIACGFWRGGVGAFAAYVNLNNDGTLNLVVGCTDVSGSRTSLAQIVAEEFGLPFEAISVIAGDTDTAPYADMSVGSRTVYTMSTAVKRACQDAKAQILHQAALILGVDAEQINFFKGILQVRGIHQKSITLAALANSSVMLHGEGPVIGRGSVASIPFAPTFSVHAADIEVDKETGKIKILSYTAAQEVGKAINPVLVEGQIQGAVAQGIGWALMEGYVFKGGAVENPTLLDYRMPTATDLPMIDTLLVEVSSASGVYGLRPVGEPPMIPPIAAIANAVHSAIGIRLKELPMTPQTVLWGISNQANGRTEDKGTWHTDTRSA